MPAPATTEVASVAGGDSATDDADAAKPQRAGAGKASKSAKIAYGKPTRTTRSGGAVYYSKTKSNAILARHDSKEHRRQRDAIDRILGL